ncbi:MAG: PTS sugar transporter subunit IIB [Schleiferilactobacillus perolens]|uniref:PTS sugar transporter subunit IIB n=1 Tax=Schleiferilactobacillus perolens TaxID=100468 RepID=UPI0039E93288
MKTIMLVCAGGMSTSLLVSKMDEAAKKENVTYKIFATGASAVPDELADKHPDVILLGPQVRHIESKVQKMTDVPVAVIDMRDYGTMNGKNVLATAVKLLDA